MQRVFLLFLVGLFLVPSAADAATGKSICFSAHFVRFGGKELRETVFFWVNGNATKSVTIERLTIRDAFGDVIHDSGPAIGVPHPLNTDFDVDEDITVVAPNRGFYFKTVHIWGFNSIPDPNGIPFNQLGFGGSTVVEFSTAGKAKLFRIWAQRRVRERIVDPISGNVRQGEEHTTALNECLSIK